MKIPEYELFGLVALGEDDQYLTCVKKKDEWYKITSKGEFNKNTLEDSLSFINTTEILFYKKSGKYIKPENFKSNIKKYDD